MEKYKLTIAFDFVVSRTKDTIQNIIDQLRQLVYEQISSKIKQTLTPF